MPIDIKKLEHECFPQPQNMSNLVWRYMDLSKLIWLLDNKKLYLSRIDLLGDPHEGSYTKKGYELLSNVLKKETKIKDPLKHAKKIKAAVSQARFNLRKGAYVNCWCLNNFESEAMWKLYCGSKNGIAIQTTYQKLVDSLSDPDLFIATQGPNNHFFQNSGNGSFIEVLEGPHAGETFEISGDALNT